MPPLIRLARPWEWLKSAFILLPVPFALADGANVDVWTLLLGVAGFSLISSSVYVINDLTDAERDRRHPQKRKRPLAAGLVSRGAARIFGAGLGLSGVALCWLASKPRALTPVLIYMCLTALYSLGGKRIALVDVFLISSGFVLRVLFGCALVEVAPSNWLLLCASTLALFLALTKRRADLVAGLDRNHRESLAGYNIGFLQQAMGLTAGVALLSYALYSMNSQVFIPGREFASLPFAAFGILDYLRRAHLRDEGGSPARVILTAPALWIAGTGWAVAVFWSLGFF